MIGNMTFGELDYFINMWGAELSDYDSIFFNQTQEMNKEFFKGQDRAQKLQVIGTHMNIINYNYYALEQILLNVCGMEQILERIILKLENQINRLANKTPIDCIRDQVYGISETINCTLHYYENETDILINGAKNKENERLKNPAEQIAQIMMSLLECLEYTEMKTEHMNRWIHNIQWQYHSMCGCSYDKK